VAFISYNALLTGPVRQIGRIISNMSKADVALGRICEIMNAEEEHYGEEEEGVVQGDIRFENVTFGYEKGKPVLQNISFTLPQGKSLGIIGSTGSGKSTLVELLDGLYPDYEGNIYVGEREIRTIPLTTLRRSMGMVLQEPYLYSKTVGENIAITDEEPNLENIRYAARVACIDDNINTFTKGYDTVVGERGVTLSGGQKQRAAIARTITLHTPVMIFDDSLSAVDSQTDAKIRAHLREECAGMTTILISHRITTIQHADNILVLDKGKIAEQGTNDELLKQGGIYKHIYDLQTSAAEEAGSIEEAGSVEEASAAEEAAEQKDKAEKTSAAKGVGYEH
jgi:ATP-binding cassette subfamily B protein